MLGSTIKQLREKSGITSQQLAEMSNVSQAYISQIENNRRQPSYNTLQAIAYALNTSIDTILNAHNNADAGSIHETSDCRPCENEPSAEHPYSYQKSASAWVARETISLNSLVDYALAIDNARRANITPDELCEAVEAIKKLKRLRR